MAIFIAPNAKQRFFDANGDPLVGGKLYSYEAGTTTLAATYADQNGSANTNPIILDANGECDLWLSDAATYKFVLTDSSDVTQWTVDEISIPSVSGSGSGNSITASSQVALTASGQITITDSGDQVITVGAASAISLSTTPFSITPSVAKRITLVGNSDTNTITLTHNDAAGGCILNGNCTLGNGQSITLMFISASNRYFEMGRSSL